MALVTTDADAVLHHPDVDMVYIATPPDLHLSYAERAAAAGKGVLVEKPAGRCAAEAAAIQAACLEAGVQAFASYYRRYLPKAQALRDLAGAGDHRPPYRRHLSFPRTGGGRRLAPGPGAFRRRQLL